MLYVLPPALVVAVFVVALLASGAVDPCRLWPATQQQDIARFRIAAARSVAALRGTREPAQLAALDQCEAATRDVAAALRADNRREAARIARANMPWQRQAGRSHITRY